MPLYEGSCGCYNWNEAKQFGVTAAILLNWFKNNYRHHKNKGELVDGMFWHDQKDIADEIAFGIKMLYNAIEVLENAGVIKKKIGYRPGSTKKTTWWGFVEGQVRLGVSESAQTAVSIESAQTAVSIYNETNNDTNGGNGGGSILDFGMMKAIVQKFIREHQSQSNPITFTPSKLKEYYPALKEWAIDNGINLDRQKILTVLENALDEMQNDGWLAGKDMAIAFKDTCIGTRMKKQQKKGGLNDNEWV